MGRRIVVLFLFFVMASSSCNKSGTCILPKGVYGTARLVYHPDSLTTKDTQLQALDIYLTDTALYYAQSQNVSGFSFYLNPGKNVQELVLEQQAGAFAIDTIRIYYNPRLGFVSNDCGFQYLFDLTDVSFTTEMIDSIHIVTPEINEDRSKTHLQIVIK